MLRRFVFAVLLVALALPLLAQNLSPPDLSGTWVLSLTKSKPAKKAVIHAETIVIKCAGSSIHFAFSSDGKESDEMYVTDGKDHAQKVTPGGELYSRAEWKRSVLITKTGARLTMPAADGYEIISDNQHWSLSADGRSLLRELEDPKQTFVYDKQ